jgi:hypothetical protein
LAFVGTRNSFHVYWHCQRAWQNQFSWSRPFTKHKQGTFPEFKTWINLVQWQRI